MDHLQEILDAAARHQSEGRLPQAERLYQQVLQEQPDNPEALSRLGLLALQADQPEQALELAGRAASLRPDDPDMLQTLGLVYLERGQHAEATACLRRVLAKQPERADARVNLAQALVCQEDDQAAEAELRQATELDPEHVQAWFNLGVLLAGCDAAQALACLERAAELSPDDWQVHSNLGTLLNRVGRHDRAHRAIQRAALLDPGNPQVCVNLSANALARGDFAAAERAAAEAATLDPQNPLALSNLGLAQLGQGKLSEAVLTFVRSISLNEDNPAAHLNLGRALLLEGKLAEATERFRVAEAQAPGVGIHDLARTRLLAGELDRAAWGGLVGLQPDADLPALEPTVLLQGSSGLGEALLLLRLAPSLRQRGHRVLLRCPPPVRRLLERADLVDGLLAPDDPPPDDAQAVALELLPLLLDLGGPSGRPPPYLPADAGLTRRWRDRLGADQGLAAGLMWKGAAMTEDPHQWIPLEHLAPLLDLDGVRWFSLQYGADEAERALLQEHGVTDLADEVRDVDEALAAMSALDRLVTPANAMAHLAGAAGLEALVLLDNAPHWCWGRADDVTAWYPTLRLRRRPCYGPWGELVAALRQELAT